jgi:DNA replication and repair protein RecF
VLIRLDIHNVRNIRETTLRELGTINVVSGANGSGKTSVLEAIHILGMARSFRSTSVKSVIQHDRPELVVFGEVGRDVAGGTHPVGVRRDRSGEADIRIAGERVTTVAELVQQLPLQVINASSFELLTGAPKARRQFLDWGVFHVEHQFLSAWQRFQRSLKQRNNLLRRDKIDPSELSVWTRELVETGDAINRYRQAFFQALVPRFEAILLALAPEMSAVALSFRQGWDKRLPYAEALDNSYTADCDQGFTHVGPQRADIRVLADGYPAADTLSRGQQKLVICALKLAQGQLLADRGVGGGTYLVDDLPAELDEAHCRLVCQSLDRLGAQVFITCVEARDVVDLWPSSGPQLRVFHVEHGVVQPAQDGLSG